MYLMQNSLSFFYSKTLIKVYNEYEGWERISRKLIKRSFKEWLANFVKVRDPRHYRCTICHKTLSLPTAG